MKQDLVGKTFGRLKVVKFIQNGRVIDWECICSCGVKRMLKRKALVSGNTKSCGCLKLDVIGARNRNHMMCGTRFYWVFHGMRARCYNKNHNRYDLYGAKGIKIQWNNFADFKADMYERYIDHCNKYGQKNTYIERRNNDKDYSKENCYWSTAVEQANNTSRNFVIEFRGKRKTLAQWCTELNLPYHSAKDRLYRGWTPEESFTVPFIKYQKYKAHRHE